MKTITVKLPDPVAAEIEAESRRRGLTKSDVIRERLQQERPETMALDSIADLIGSVKGLPADMSGKKKTYLRQTNYGRDRSR
jgi:hypothetical protein